MGCLEACSTDRKWLACRCSVQRFPNTVFPLSAQQGKFLLVRQCTSIFTISGWGQSRCCCMYAHVHQALLMKVCLYESVASHQH